MFRRLSLVVATAVVLTTLVVHLDALDVNRRDHWVATWSTALHAPAAGPPGLTNSGFNNQTLRQIVRATVGGQQVRVRLSTFAASALQIGAARIALRSKGPSIVPESDRVLTFGGHSSITVPPGAVVMSDAVDLDVPALSDLAVSIFVQGETGPATWHFLALQTSYVSPDGDFTTFVDMPVASTKAAWFWLAGVDVLTSKQTAAIAVLGDSVTDGNGSTLDANRRWPDELARRLMMQAGNHKMGVLNGGLTGNRLLHDIIGPNGLARFDRDVLAQTSLTHVIVFLGNNDIVFGQFFPTDAVTVDEIIQGYRVLIARAHSRGVRIYGATLTPFQGFVPSDLFPIVEPQRQAVNHFIRTSGEFDAVIDFDAITRDPSMPSRFLPLFDSGDHYHPNDAGYRAMGDALDLSLFKNGKDH